MATHSDFGAQTEASEVINAFAEQVTGKAVLITGIALEGLGGAIALAVASQSPSLLILAGRTPSKINAVISAIASKYPLVSTRALELDLSSNPSIQNAAGKVLAYSESIDVLINNAGIMDLRSEGKWNEKGIEQHFAVNHLGPFLFTNLISPKVIAAAESRGAARIVNVASAASPISPIRFHDLAVKKPTEELPGEERPNLGFLTQLQIDVSNVYIPFIAYAQSKTATILYTVELADKLRSKNVVVLTLHPGQIRTDLQRTITDADLGLAATFPWKSIAQGAATTLVAAFDPSLKENSGSYLEDCQIANTASFATDKLIAEKLWTVSESMVGQSFSF